MLITQSAEVNASALCRKRGGNITRGQNKIPVFVTASQVVLAEEIKNGTIPYQLITADPKHPLAAEAGCPNGKWTAEINDVSCSLRLARRSADEGPQRITTLASSAANHW